jgi:hypothetical protein
LPTVEGIAGAFFAIYHGQVNEDSDGPLEWCRPVPDDQAEELAEELAESVPELTLRTEPAHSEAFVNLGHGAETSPAKWELVMESLHEWNESKKMPMSDLGVRITYLVTSNVAAQTGPDCDFAVPFVA